MKQLAKLFGGIVLAAMLAFAFAGCDLGGPAGFESTVATPTANLAAGAYYSTGGTNFGINLTTTTSGATIHYTTDGSTPTVSSTAFTENFIIGQVKTTATVTVRAIAVKEGMNNSAEFSRTYTFGDTIPTSGITPINAANWTNSSIDYSLGAKWFRFTATAATQYIHFPGSTLGDSMTSANVSLHSSSGTVINLIRGTDPDGDGSAYQNLNGTNLYARNATALISGQTYYIRVWNTSSTFRIGVNTAAGTTPSTVFPASTTLTNGTWVNGNIATADGEQWFKFTAAATGSQYIFFDHLGSLSWVSIMMYNADGAVVGGTQNISYTGSFTRSVTSGQEYYIKVTPYQAGSSGTFSIGINTSTTYPVVTLPASPTTIATANTWVNGNIATAGGEQWFKVTAAATNAYVHFDWGTLGSINVRAYNAQGVSVGNSGTYTGGSRYLQVYNLTNGEEFYIRVRASSTGTYKIGFSASSAWTEAVTLPTTGITALTANTWANGNIASATGEQWFRFTTTENPHYIHFVEGTMSNVYVQLYDTTGNVVGSQPSLSSSYTSTVNSSLTSGSTYYIRVRPNGSSTGTYRIAFNNSSIGPAIILPTTGITTLTANTWANGNITTAGGDQWFSFTATAATQYIHFPDYGSDLAGSLSQVYVRLYNADGTVVPLNRSYFNGYDNLEYLNITNTTDLAVGQPYYFRVWPMVSTNSGTYKLAFNTSDTRPPFTVPTEGVTALTAETWTDGNITTAGGDQWFSFTATADTHYIHFSGNLQGLGGNLTDVLVSLYDSTSASVSLLGGAEDYSTEYLRNLYSNFLYAYNDSTLTIGQTYYIRLKPYSSSGSGTYKLAFNESDTRPDNP